MAAVTQLSIPPLIKTTAFSLLGFGFIFVAVGLSRAWILMTLARESQRVRHRARPRPKCIYEAEAGAAPEGRHRESSGPDLWAEVPRATGKRARDFSFAGVCRCRSLWTTHNPPVRRSRI